MLKRGSQSSQTASSLRFILSLRTSGERVTRRCRGESAAWHGVAQTQSSFYKTLDSMEQAIELAVSSSSFFKGTAVPVHEIPSQHARVGRLKQPAVDKLKSPAPSSPLSIAASLATSRVNQSLTSTLKNASLKYGKPNWGHALADTFYSMTAFRSFGASFEERYGVSEPQKVNGTTLQDSAGDDVLHSLKQGFVKFKEERFLKEADRFSELAKGQQPKVMVIACADSRVCPTMLMGLDPGEVFVVRNVANLVPPCEKRQVALHGTSAALEFAVTGLGVEQIIVMGHRNCGGIRALMSRKTDDIQSDFIGRWMSCALPAKKHTLAQMEGRSVDDQNRFCEMEAINGSLANLLTFPWIKEKFDSGALGLHGWYYDFVEGDLTSWKVQHSSAKKSVDPSLVGSLQ